ncbi:hypothetical protein C9374_002099 [Naegleria lovaniensis]|uniref:phospholipase D n=1 Tax=Naegleria lovaniensis TaxID=51637 RepID=A0AA88GWK2_NAELO|nr:uncharacterized protein C9374_002099 [Naegleria lovaniensis]KAG2387064.1 hypothetical protein C9374_002099 [Naegleria lovaniensis]
MGQKQSKKEKKPPSSSQSAQTSAFISSVSGDVGDDFAMLPAILGRPNKKNARFQQQLKAMQVRLDRYKKDMELLSKTHLSKDEFRLLRSLFTSFCKECLNVKESSTKKQETSQPKPKKTSEDYSLYLTREECYKVFFPKIELAQTFNNFERTNGSIQIQTNVEDVYSEEERVVLSALFNAACDFNKRKLLTFHRFVMTISAMCRGTFEEKVEWTFSFYDYNHEGYISKPKLLTLMKALESMDILKLKSSPRPKSPATTFEEELEQIVDAFFDCAKKAQNENTLFKRVNSNTSDFSTQDRIDLHGYSLACKENDTFLNALGIVETFFVPILKPINDFVHCDNPYEIEGSLFIATTDETEAEIVYSANTRSENNLFKRFIVDIRGGLLNGYCSITVENQKKRAFSIDLRKIDAIENETQIISLPLLEEMRKEDTLVISDEISNNGSNTLNVGRVSHKRTNSFPVKPTHAIVLSPAFSITMSKAIYDEIFEQDIELNNLNESTTKKEATEKKKSQKKDPNEKKKIVFIADSSEVKMLWIFTILMYHLDHRKGIEGEACRFNSFSPERQKVRAKWYVDGKDAFSDIAIAITLAKEEIFISDWCLHPTMYLLRGSGKEVADSRLDILLKKKASQGVKIYILLWNETTLAFLNLNTKRTKAYLKSLYPKNIFVKTHPKKFPTEWSHHQKLVIIDQSIAFLGGLDLCYGRWDDYHHNITDMNHSNCKYPGNDYNNPNIEPQYKSVDKLDNFKDCIDREYIPRQAWHDIHCMVTGLAAKDCSFNFVERWNFAFRNSEGSKHKLLTLKNPGKNPLLEYYDIKQRRKKIPIINPFHLGDVLQVNDTTNKESSDNNPTTAKEIFKSKLSELDPRNRRKKIEEEEDKKLAQIEQDLKEKVDEEFARHQPLIKESDTDASDAEPPSPSPQKQQGNADEGTPTRELRIVAHKNKHKISAKTRSKNIITTDSPKHKKDAIQQKIKKFQCADEGYLCNAQVVRSLCKWSGSPRDEQSVYAAYLYMIDNAKHYIYIENQYFIGSGSEVAKNVIPEYISRKIVEKMKQREVFRVMILLPSHPEGKLTNPTTQQVMKYTYKTIKHGVNSMYSYIKKHVPGATDSDIENYLSFCTIRNYGFLNCDWRSSMEEADVIRLGNFQDILDEDETSDDSFSNHSDKFRALMIMKTTDSGKKAVTEHIYVHSKLMIVDDNITIIGSANINDRSMLGTRDSEIAVVIQDHPSSTINTKMNGKSYKSGKFAHSLRIRCWREHLGLLPSQNEKEDEELTDEELQKKISESEHDADNEDESDEANIFNLKNLNINKNKTWKKWQRQRIENKMKKLIRNDPICDETFKGVWLKTAKHNTDIYEAVFPDTLISNKFTTLDEYLESSKIVVNEKDQNKEMDNENLKKEKSKKSSANLSAIASSKKAVKEEEELVIEEERPKTAPAQQPVTGTSLDETPSKHVDQDDTSPNNAATRERSKKAKELDSALSEPEKRKLLKQLKGNLCLFPLDFASKDTWSKPFHVSVAVGDNIFV